MELFKKVWNGFTGFVANRLPFMSPMSWMGTLAFAFGFFVGSEGEWEGALFFTLFWIVGIFIMDGYLKMRDSKDETKGN